MEMIVRDEQSCKKVIYDRPAEATHRLLPQPSPIPYHPSLPAAQHGGSGECEGQFEISIQIS